MIGDDDCTAEILSLLVHDMRLIYKSTDVKYSYINLDVVQGQFEKATGRLCAVQGQFEKVTGGLCVVQG